MSEQKHYAAILFDLDGTLIDTAPDLVAATNALRREHGLQSLPYDDVRAIVSMGGAALTRLALENRATNEAHARLLELYAHLLGENSQAYEGLTDCLNTLVERGFSWGIVTNKERRFAEPLLSRLKLAPGVLVCGDDLPCAKPDPRPLLSAMSHLDQPPGAGIYLGDHQRDIDAAQRAGMDSVAAGYGYLAKGEDPLAWGATVTVYTPNELAEYLLALPIHSLGKIQQA